MESYQLIPLVMEFSYFMIIPLSALSQLLNFYCTRCLFIIFFFNFLFFLSQSNLYIKTRKPAPYKDNDWRTRFYEDRWKGKYPPPLKYLLYSIKYSIFNWFYKKLTQLVRIWRRIKQLIKKVEPFLRMILFILYFN